MYKCVSGKAGPMLAPFSLLLVIFGASCAKVPVQTRSPELPTPKDWTASKVSDAEVDSQWWTGFEDPDLSSFVEEALRANYDLRSAAARLEVAAGQAKIAGARLLPTVDVGVDGRRSRQNFIGFPIPGADQRVLSRTFTTFGVSLNVGWEADLWSKLKAGEVAGLADYGAVEADLRGARMSIAGQVCKVRFAALEAAQQKELAERTVASYETTVTRIRQRYQQGLQSSLDLRLALSSLAGAEALRQLRNEELDRATRQLEVLLGRYPSAGLSIRPLLPPVPALPAAGLPSELVSRRPDLVSAQMRLMASDARIVESKKALYPSLILATSGGTATRDFLDLLNGNFLVWSLLGNLVQPIFEGGRLRAEIAISESRSREALASFAGAVLNAYSEVESTLAAEETLSARETELAEASVQSAAAWRLAEDRYDSGLEPFVTVLESQRRALEAEGQLFTVRRLRLDARVDLHLALGGGF